MRRPRIDFSIWKWVVAARGDLRKVGDAKHLEPLAQMLQLRRPTSATSPPIPRRPRRRSVSSAPVSRSHGLQREHESRQLPTGYDPCKRLEDPRPVRRDKELGLIDSALGPGIFIGFPAPPKRTSNRVRPSPAAPMRLRPARRTVPAPCRRSRRILWPLQVTRRIV